MCAFAFSVSIPSLGFLHYTVHFYHFISISYIVHALYIVHMYSYITYVVSTSNISIMSKSTYHIKPQKIVFYYTCMSIESHDMTCAHQNMLYCN